MGASYDLHDDCRNEFVILNVLLTSWMSHVFQWMWAADHDVHVGGDLYADHASSIPSKWTSMVMSERDVFLPSPSTSLPVV